MEVQVIKSNRKTVAIQINADLTVTMRVPRRATKRDIQKILKEKEGWILKHLMETLSTSSMDAIKRFPGAES